MSPDSLVVLVVGAASRDVVTDDPRGWRLGGAVTFCSLAMARLGFEVRAVMGVDGEAAAAEELVLLHDAGVTIAVAELASGPVFDNVTHHLHATADRIPVTALPRRWTSGFEALLAVPVADEVGDEWAELAAPSPSPARASVAARRANRDAPLLALGWQGLLRELVAGEVIRPRPPAPSPLVAAARLAVVSREDIAAGVRPEALAALLAPASTVAVTESAEGGWLVDRAADGTIAPPRRYPAIPSDQVIDPTGAGDVFLASLLAATLRPELAAPYDAATFAAAAGSLTVEGPGLAGVPDLAAVRRRLTRAPSRANR